MKESALKQQLREEFDTIPDIFYTKVHGSLFGQKGAPDFIVCFRGLYMGIETKVVGGKLSPMQERKREQILAAGGYYIVGLSVTQIIHQIFAYWNEWYWPSLGHRPALRLAESHASRP